MNLIPKIAELLGVEIEEAFKLSEYAGIKHKFTKTGLFYEDSDGEWKLDPYTTFMDLLLGRYEAFKLPFKPKEGEQYYMFTFNGGDFCLAATEFDEYCIVDLTNLYCGNCFRTKEEANNNKAEIYEKLTGKKWEE